MRSDFISMLSHEIRTPLTSIRESVHLIVEEVMGDINDKQRRFLEMRHPEIERITTLLNQPHADFTSRSGAVEIRPQPIDALGIRPRAISRVIPAAEAKEITISADIAPGSPKFSADPDNLQQVLLNLLGNAIKFSPAGSGIVVTVRQDASDKGTELVFCGIRQRTRQSRGGAGPRVSQVLQGFGVRDEVDGVGLGLSISKYIVEAHGAYRAVRSNPGSGSTFSSLCPYFGSIDYGGEKTYLEYILLMGCALALVFSLWACASSRRQ